MDDEKNVSFLLIILELVIVLVNLVIKVEIRDNVDLWGSYIIQSYREVLDIVIKSLDKVNYIIRLSVYNSGDMYNYCINYVNFELFVEFFN